MADNKDPKLEQWRAILELENQIFLDDIPYIACKICDRKLGLFETIY